MDWSKLIAVKNRDKITFYSSSKYDYNTKIIKVETVIEKSIYLFYSLFGDSGEGKGQLSNDGTITVPLNETINIFSLASGHLYERFLRWELLLHLLIHV